MPATVDAASYLNQSSVGSKPRASASSNPFKNQSKAAGGRPLRRHQSDKKDLPPRSPEADADWRGDVAPDVGAGPTLKAQLDADAKDRQRHWSFGNCQCGSTCSSLANATGRFQKRTLGAPKSNSANTQKKLIYFLLTYLSGRATLIPSTSSASE